VVTEEAGRQREILIATGNPAKYREIAAVLADCGTRTADCGLRIADRGLGGLGGANLKRPGTLPVMWRSLDDLSQAIAAPVEDGATFARNAALKAVHYSRLSGRWALADDSGLEVDALEGAPGVRSARYAAAPAGAGRAQVDRANNRKLIAELKDVPLERRTARFRCALALADGEQVLATAEGTIEGLIVDEPRGSNGFGYDPHFFVPRLGRTTAELSPEHKNRISHRGQAVQRFREALETLLAEGR
jgi:XTP/dITP diphosphohydrolase